MLLQILLLMLSLKGGEMGEVRFSDVTVFK